MKKKKRKKNRFLWMVWLWVLFDSKKQFLCYSFVHFFIWSRFLFSTIVLTLPANILWGEVGSVALSIKPIPNTQTEPHFQSPSSRSIIETEDFALEPLPVFIDSFASKAFEFIDLSAVCFDPFDSVCSACWLSDRSKVRRLRLQSTHFSLSYSFNAA